MRKILMLGVSLILILAAQPSQLQGQVSQAVQPALDINWTTTRLGTIPKKYNRIISILFSPDGRRATAVVLGQVGCFVIDGAGETDIQCLSPSARGDTLYIVGEPIFSPDGRKLAYVAEKGFQFSVVMNGKEGKRYGEINDLVFSPDSRKLAYAAADDGKRFIVLDDREGISYDYIWSPTFSPDSQKLAFIARRDWKEIVVVMNNGGEKESKSYDRIDSFTFSPDSQKIVYVAQQGGRSLGVGGKYSVVIRDSRGVRESRQYDRIAWRPVFSPDGQQMAYIAEEGGKYFVVISDSAGDHEGRRYDQIIWSPVYSRDSQQLAYIAVEGGKYFIVVNNRPQRTKLDVISSLGFMPGTQEIVYSGRKDRKSYLVVGDRESEPYEGIRTSVSSPDGKEVLLVASSAGSDYVVFWRPMDWIDRFLGAKEGKRYGHVAPYGQPHGPIFSSDSQKFAYVATRQKELKSFFVVDGDNEGKDYDSIKSLAFSPNSKVLVYPAMRGTKQFVVIGNKEGKPFDEVVTDPIFSPDSKKIAYGARLSNDLWWIVEDVPE